MQEQGAELINVSNMVEPSHDWSWSTSRKVRRDSGSVPDVRLEGYVKGGRHAAVYEVYWVNDTTTTSNGSTRGRSSVMEAVFNLTNSIIGAGIIGMPYAVREAGFCAGVLLIVLMGYLTDYSLRLLIRSGQLAGAASYQSMVRIALGRAGFVVLSAAQFAFPLSGMVTYTIVVGHTLPVVFERLWGPDTALADLAADRVDGAAVLRMPSAR